MTRTLDDVNVVVSGHAGDGSLTLVNLLGDLLGRRGLNLYQSRSVASRIKGGTAAACLRASRAQRGCLGDHIDLFVTFDDRALETFGPSLADGAVVIHDASDGPVQREMLPPGATVIDVPFGRLAVRELRRDLYKNALAFGVAARLVGAGDDEAEATLRRRLTKLSAPLVEANVLALRGGFEHAGESAWRLDDGEAGGRMLISGNEAAAFGFLAAGGRFFAGYPITPASEILDWLSARLPEYGGLAVQAEDELSAINMALGAAMAGVRSMTASSGPGIALMQEGIGHLGAAEIGVVVVDCQRAGPSTGMPTKPEQSDVGMLLGGVNGDIPRIVLAPGDPREAFELTALAVNLAERYQGPVYVALDQAVSQDWATVERFDLDAVTVDRGKVLGEDALAQLGEYRRYALTEDGISPWAPFGTPGGEHLVTGNEHDEWGLVSAQPANRVRMIEKRMRKLDTVRADLPRGRRLGDPSADVALVGFGMEAGVIAEALERLDLPVQALVVRTLWPVLEDVLELAASCRTVYVVEHNAGGQYAAALAAAGAPAGRIESILRYDGVPFRPGELAALIEERES